MLEFSFKYNNFDIKVFDCEGFYHVKCIDDKITFCVIHDFNQLSDCFSYIPKLLAFLDSLV